MTSQMGYTAAAGKLESSESELTSLTIPWSHKACVKLLAHNLEVHVRTPAAHKHHPAVKKHTTPVPYVKHVILTGSSCVPEHTHLIHSLTIVHEWLHRPQLGAHDKAANVAGNVWV